MVKTFDVAYFNGARDPVAASCARISWDDAVRMLTDYDYRDSKDGRQWAPVRLDGNGYRAQRHVVSVSMLVADLDHGISELQWLLWSLRDVAHIIHSTHNHTMAQPRLRLVVPLEQPVKAADWGNVHRCWMYRLSTLGVNPDRSCKDAARAYYLPSCPLSRASERLVIVGRKTDAFLGVDALPSPPKPEQKALFGHDIRVARRRPYTAMLSAAIKLARRVGRNNAGFWLACTLRDNGYLQRDAEEVMMRYQQAVRWMDRLPEYTETEALHSVRSAYTRDGGQVRDVPRLPPAARAYGPLQG